MHEKIFLVMKELLGLIGEVPVMPVVADMNETESDYDDFD